MEYFFFSAKELVSLASFEVKKNVTYKQLPELHEKTE